MKHSKKKLMNMNALILAGGEGKRAKKNYPKIPKALIPICGTPIVQFLITTLKGADLFDETFLNVRLQDERFFHDLKVPLLLEKEFLGNAGAIKRFAEYLSDVFLVHHCDIFSDINYKKLFEAFQKSNVLGIMALAMPKKAGNFGVPQLKANKIVGFQRDEKAKGLVNGGVYFFKKEIISLIEDGFQDLDKDLFPKLIEKNELSYYIHSGSWMDVGG